MAGFPPDTWVARFIENSRRLRTVAEIEAQPAVSPAEVHYILAATRDSVALFREACEAEHRWANDERRVA